MSKVTLAIIPLIIIILLSVFFFFSPGVFGSKAAGGDTALNEVLVKRFTDIGNLIAHATFVEDAIIMDETANLEEVIDQFSHDQPELTYIYFTDAKNKVIASSDPERLDEIYDSELLKSGPSAVEEKNGLFEGGFSINIGKTRVGALYFGAKPETPGAAGSTASNPIVLAIGIVAGFVVFFITLAMARGVEANIVDGISGQQEEALSAKMETLKKEQEKAQQKVSELKSKAAEAKQDLQRLSSDYEVKKKEIEDNPVAQSVEKLKSTESELQSRLQTLKDEEQRLNKEVTLLSGKREEVKSALEAEKKEESTLHERLDLIKKKILHLETPKK